MMRIWQTDLYMEISSQPNESDQIQTRFSLTAATTYSKGPHGQICPTRNSVKYQPTVQ